MASSDFWQRLSTTRASEPEKADAGAITRHGRGASKAWMVADLLTVFATAAAVTLFRFRTSPMVGARELWHGTPIGGRPIWYLPALLFGFTIVLVLVSRRLHLYEPQKIPSILREQRFSAQACLSSGLLLTGALYLLKATFIPRSVVLAALALIALVLGIRRLVYRILLYRRFERGIDTRNVLIVGTGHEAQALRHHMETLRHLGYTFKGFVALPEAGSPHNAGLAAGDPLQMLFDHARKHFVDEILLTTRCDRDTIEAVLDQARLQSIDLRVVPDLYDGLGWNSPVEYIGQFPTIPLHRNHVPELGLIAKRAFDFVFSLAVLIALLPVFLVIAIAIKIDSPGSIFYSSDRIGKKGRIFRCTKFRTMIPDAERRKADLLHMNERDGVLFKVANDPRITRLGRFLRKYSLDELPQFWNVLMGEMSIVGPRPPLKAEVKEYKLNHLRRLDVMPGITGLWQVQGRKDPSFASYVSLDVTYIDNWSIWLDFKIILRTLGVILAGTGT